MCQEATAYVGDLTSIFANIYLPCGVYCGKCLFCVVNTFLKFGAGVGSLKRELHQSYLSPFSPTIYVYLYLVFMIML